MKTIILLALCLCAGCEPIQHPVTSRVVNYRIYVIENCEYVGVGGDGFAHKGNCTNSIHVYRKME